MSSIGMMLLEICAPDWLVSYVRGLGLSTREELPRMVPEPSKERLPLHNHGCEPRTWHCQHLATGSSCRSVTRFVRASGLHRVLK